MSRANPLTTHPDAGIPANMQINTFRDLKVKSWDDCRMAVMVIDKHQRKSSRINQFGFTDYSLASNVYLRERLVHRSGLNVDSWIAVVLYDTEIVRYYPDQRTFSVDNGGFNTPTTSTRINQFTPDGWWFGHNHKRLVTLADAIGLEPDFRNYGQGWVVCTHKVKLLVNRKEQ